MTIVKTVFFFLSFGPIVLIAIEGQHCCLFERLMKYSENEKNPFEYLLNKDKNWVVNCGILIEFLMGFEYMIEEDFRPGVFCVLTPDSSSANLLANSAFRSFAQIKLYFTEQHSINRSLIGSPSVAGFALSTIGTGNSPEKIRLKIIVRYDQRAQMPN